MAENSEEYWKTPAFRQKVLRQIDDAIQNSNNSTSKNSTEMENQLFKKAKSKDEYLGFVARVILHLSGMSSQRTNPQITAALGSQGMNQGHINSVNNLQLNQHAGMQSQLGQALQQQHSQQAALGNIKSNLASQLHQGNNMANMNNQMMNQMNQNMPNQMGHSGGSLQTMLSHQNIGNQQNMNMGQQVTINDQNMLQQVNVQQHQNSNNRQRLTDIQVQQMNMAKLRAQSQNQPSLQQTLQSGRLGHQLGVQGNLIQQGNSQNTLLNTQQSQLTRQLQKGKSEVQEMTGSGHPVHHMTHSPSAASLSRQGSTSQYMGQSPNPNFNATSTSPVTNVLTPGSSGQSVLSPAHAHSPSSQMLTSPASIPAQRSVGGFGVSSPSGNIASVPPLGSVGPNSTTPSPHGSQEDQVYLDKIKQLRRYIEPLKRMIAKIGEEDMEKLSKMKKLLDILMNPNERVPMDTLLKCEPVLERLEQKDRAKGDSGLPPPTSGREQHVFQPLIDAIAAHIKSPFINHTLQRTFAPSLEALFGPEIKCPSPPPKKPRLHSDPFDIPDVLQGEVARLDQRFKVNLDPNQNSNCRTISLICQLDDKDLPCVPPIGITVPEGYPKVAPHCCVDIPEYESTQFLQTVKSSMVTRINKLPSCYSVSILLNTWEMAVRQACSPRQYNPPASTFGLILGL